MQDMIIIDQLFIFVPPCIRIIQLNPDTDPPKNLNPDPEDPESGSGS